MKIVLFSTNSNHFDGIKFLTDEYPEVKENLSKLTKIYSDVKLSIATQLPGKFLIDYEGTEIKNKLPDVEYTILKGNDAQTIAEEIYSLRPDVVIEASFWERPYDWLSVMDSMICRELEDKGIKTVSNSIETCLTCFDKAITQQKLFENKFNIAKGIYVHHNLFLCAGTKKAVKTNVYRESVLYRIQKLNFPVVIKDTCGLSSYGMEVCQTFEEVKTYLDSKRNNSDRLVEELVQGEQFGIELYSTKSGYKMGPLYKFTTNKWGITSPKLSVKAGPVKQEKYKLDELEATLLRLAKIFNLKGVAQFDLVFSNDKWFIIEINPRLSGMSECSVITLGKSVQQILLETVLDEKKTDEENYAISLKFEVLDKEKIEKIKNFDFIKKIIRIENLNARQLREMGYTEIILSSKNSFNELKANLESLKKECDFLSEEEFVHSFELLDSIETNTMNL